MVGYERSNNEIIPSYLPMPREELRRPMGEPFKEFMEPHEFIVQVGVGFQRFDGLQEVVLFLAIHVAPGPTPTALTVAGAGR